MSFNYQQIKQMRDNGQSWDKIERTLGCGSLQAYTYFKNHPKTPSPNTKTIQTDKGELKAIRCDSSFLCPVCGKRKKTRHQYCSFKCRGFSWSKRREEASKE